MSTCRSLASVLASVSSRCTRRSASASGSRATSSACRAAGMRRLGAHRGRLRLRDRGLRGVGGLRQRHQVGPAGGAHAELRQLGLDAGKLARRGAFARSLWESSAACSWLRRAVRSASVPVSSPNVFSAAASTASASATRRSASVRFSALAPASRLQRLLFGDEARQRRFGVGGQPALALDVGGELNEPLVELDHAVLGAGFFLFERLARDHQPLQRGGGPAPRPRAAAAWRTTPRPGGWRPAPARRCVRRPRGRRGCGPARPPPARHWRRPSADGTASPRRCAPAPRCCGSGPPGAPASSAQSIWLASWLMTSSSARGSARRRAAAARPRGGAHAGRRCRPLLRARGGAARAWPG